MHETKSYLSPANEILGSVAEEMESLRRLRETYILKLSALDLRLSLLEKAHFTMTVFCDVAARLESTAGLIGEGDEK